MRCRGPDWENPQDSVGSHERYSHPAARVGKDLTFLPARILSGVGHEYGFAFHKKLVEHGIFGGIEDGECPSGRTARGFAGDEQLRSVSAKRTQADV
jgi:hypothetical protein